MAYFKPLIYQAIGAGPLRFDIMKFCCNAYATITPMNTAVRKQYKTVLY